MPRVAQVRTRPRAARGGRDEGQVLLLRVGGVGGQLLLLLAGGEGGPLNSGVGFSCNNQPTGGFVLPGRPSLWRLGMGGGEDEVRTCIGY